MSELAHRLVDAALEAGLEGRSADLAEEAYLRALRSADIRHEIGAWLADLELLADLGARRRSRHPLGS
jgi:hypothetical protein